MCGAALARGNHDIVTVVMQIFVDSQKKYDSAMQLNAEHRAT